MIVTINTKSKYAAMGPDQRKRLIITVCNALSIFADDLPEAEQNRLFDELYSGYLTDEGRHLVDMKADEILFENLTSVRSSQP